MDERPVALRPVHSHAGPSPGVMVGLVVLAWASLLAVGCVGPSPATVANTLTAAEISDGWVLIFDGETSAGWAPRGDARWIVESGELTTEPGSGAGMLATTTEFADFELKVDFWIDATANSGVFLRAPAEGEITALNAYEVNIYDAHAIWPTGSINEVGRVQGSPKSVGQWNSYHLIAQGQRLSVQLNGATVLEANDPRLTRGVIALQQFDGRGTVKFRNLKLRPLGLASTLEPSTDLSFRNLHFADLPPASERF